MEMDEYIDVLKECLEIIPDDVVIHRMTGDGDKKLLVAPVWSADKKRVLNAIQKAQSASIPIRRPADMSPIPAQKQLTNQASACTMEVHRVCMTRSKQ